MKTLSTAEISAHRSNNNEPAIYCGTYAKYNEGNLFGMWIALNTFEDYEDFLDFCNRLHADEESPELMFQDYENFPECWYNECGIGEENFDKIIEYARLSENEQEAYKTYLENFGSEKTLDDFREAYMGEYRNPEDFAEEIFRECYEIPQHLEYYIDWRAVWRDMDTNGDFTEIGGYIFRPY